MSELFRVMGPRRADLSGLPYGFLLIWRPRLTRRYDPVVCAWSFGVYWYPWTAPKFRVRLGAPA